MSYIPDRNEEGAYNKNNLKDEFDKGYIKALDDLLDESFGLENMKENIIDDMVEDNETVIGKLKIEIINEFFKELHVQIDMLANEVNTSFIDNQD